VTIKSYLLILEEGMIFLLSEKKDTRKRSIEKLPHSKLLTERLRETQGKIQKGWKCPKFT
jgi:hypothetical protein